MSHPSTDNHPRHPLATKARVLLSSVFGPYGQDDQYGSRKINPMELYQNQVTRLQGAFSLRMFHRSFGLMMIQSNIDAPCTLLDFPSLERFEQEIITKSYDVIGISGIIANVGKVARMCQLIRRHQPGATIVVGGHIANKEALDQLIDADMIVRGEGVRWFQRFLGQDDRAAIKHPFQPGFPVDHFVQFVKHHQARRRRPALIENHPPIRSNIPIQQLGIRPRQCQFARQCGFPCLPGARKKYHLACKIGLNERDKRAFHHDYFPATCKKVKTILQVAGRKSIKVAGSIRHGMTQRSAFTPSTTPHARPASGADARPPVRGRRATTLRRRRVPVPLAQCLPDRRSAVVADRFGARR